MSTIEKLQVLIRSDKTTVQEFLRLVIHQTRLINKYPPKQRRAIIDSLWSIEPQPLTKAEIGRFMDEIYAVPETKGSDFHQLVVAKVKSGMRSVDIARELSISKETIRTIKARNGLSSPNLQRFSEQELKQAVEEGLSVKKMSHRFNVTEGAITKRLKRAGLKSLARAKQVKVDDNTLLSYFRKGWIDEHIAKEVGISRQSVSKRRIKLQKYID